MFECDIIDIEEAKDLTLKRLKYAKEDSFHKIIDRPSSGCSKILTLPRCVQNRSPLRSHRENLMNSVYRHWCCLVTLG